MNSSLATRAIPSDALDSPAARPGLRRKVATAAVMTGLVVSAFEATVVTSAMPAIARELHGMELFPWVFASFLIASTIAVPLFGKVADRAGRRPAFAIGMGLFLAGSALCGTAHSMGALVAFRVIQGLGAGAIGPVGTTVSGDLYTLEERARIQGLFTAAWGLANVAGPLIGGAIVLHASWRWVFLVNLPVGLCAVVLLWLSYVDPPRRASRGPLDLAGAALAALGVGAFLLALEQHAPAGALGRVALAAIALVACVRFARRQARIADPLVPPALVRDPVIRGAVIGSVFVGALVNAPAAYVPLWVMREMHGDALTGGLALVPSLAGWAVGSTVGVRVMVRHGPRATALGGFVLCALGASALAYSAANGLTLGCALGSLFVLGLGLGPAGSALLLGAQSRAGWASRGVATSLVHAARALGGSIGVALLGSVASAGSTRFALIAATAWGAALTVARAVPRGVAGPAAHVGLAGAAD